MKKQIKEINEKIKNENSEITICDLGEGGFQYYTDNSETMAVIQIEEKEQDNKMIDSLNISQCYCDAGELTGSYNENYTDISNTDYICSQITNQV